MNKTTYSMSHKRPRTWPRTWPHTMTRLALIVGAAASVMVGGAAVAAQFGTEAGSGKNALLPAPPTPPVPPTPTIVSIHPNQPGGSGGAGSGGGASSSFNMVVNDNGRTIKLEMKDNVVTHAEVDGQSIPDSQITNDGQTVTLKDDKGEVLYETAIGGGGAGAGATFFSGSTSGFNSDDPAWRGLLHIAPKLNGLGHGRAFSINGLNALNTIEPGETPVVMIGVQLGVPDSTLCGHLGIERGKSTLLTAVHEGLPAAAAGLEPYDLIVSVSGKDEAAPAAVRAALKDKKAGETVALGIIHKGVRKDVSVTVEAYDRKKLAESKVRAIDGTDDGDVFAVASAPMSPTPPMPPLPPSIPEEYRKQIEQYYKENGAARGQSYLVRPRSRAAAEPGTSQKLLAEIERSQQEAARRADEAAKHAHELVQRLHEQAPAAAAEMQERMRRMEEMLEKLMQEKLGQPKPQEPAGKDAGGRS